MGFNHGIHRIHGTIVSLALLFGVAVSAVAAEPGITVEARQRYPWNGLVDVKCVLEGDGARDYKVTLAVKDETGGTNLPARTFWQNGGTVTNSAQIVRPGNLHFVWDANADIAEDGFECDRVSVKVQVEVERDKVQLWEGGPYWATTNIGAEKPEDYGYYFWWGDTVGYKRENNAWVASDGSSMNFSFATNTVPTWVKDISILKSEGWITEDGVLAPEHDAAHIHWGGDWRMPTKQEMDNLNNNCDWTWTTMNGVAGYVVRGRGDYASNSIFLPCAGYGISTSFANAGSFGKYWSSVPHTGNYSAWFLYFYSGYHCTDYCNRYDGHSIRPVQGSVSALTNSVSAPANVSATDGTLTANVTVTWSAVASATSYEIWRGTSNDSALATKIGTITSTSYSDTSAIPGTTYYYWVKAVTSAGTSTFSSSDSGYKKTVAHDKVQLWEGGPYWATTNIGAEKPEDYGYYFWWGDTVGYKRENNAWVASDGSATNFSFTSSNTPTYGKDIVTLQTNGWITAEGVLAPEHDAAHIHWGGDWRMPTKQEMDDLNNNCDWTWTTMNGVAGYVVRGRGECASNSIFLLCAGDGHETLLGVVGLFGYCWSSVPYSDSYHGSGGYAWYLGFGSSFHKANYLSRRGGLSVRPVQGFTK